MPAGVWGQALSEGVGWDVYKRQREKKCLCFCMSFFPLQSLSHTRLMAGVEMFKWTLYLLQIESIYQILLPGHSIDGCCC